MTHSFLQRTLFKISSYLPCRIISGNQQQPYLERYHLLTLPFNIQIYLHRFVSSDPGQCLHNHPWKAALSFILSGQYIETRLDKTKADMPFRKRIVKAGNFNYINGEIYHRIDIEQKTSVWSLFMHSKKQESWGFMNTTNHQFAYQDHNQLVEQHNDPKWWVHADKPKNNPSMRQEL
ncbi:MAG: hypothetical protein ISR69_08440 [Gammaproteobacteria bacterium]|nr:hypothetical protein [Gammaproteobacteria bacterium]